MLSQTSSIKSELPTESRCSDVSDQCSLPVVVLLHDLPAGSDINNIQHNDYWQHKVSGWVEFYVPLESRHILWYFGDKSFQAIVSEMTYYVLRRTKNSMHSGTPSFQAITCTGTDNLKQTRENTPKTQNNQTGPR